MTTIRSWILAITIGLWAHPAGADERSEQIEKKEQRIHIDQIYEGCVRGVRRDQLCDAVIQLKQIGDDTVETIKALVPLGPFEYAVLTAGNFAVTGRLRLKPQKLISANWGNTIDYHRDGTIEFLIERNF